MTTTFDKKPCLWDSEYVIDNLPPWIYSDNQPPESIQACKAKISSIEYTIEDIDLQISIRELELKTGHSRHNSAFDYEKWKIQALRARQTHLYLLSAYKYWLILNERKEVQAATRDKLERVIELLIDEPDDFVEQLEKLK